MYLHKISVGNGRSGPSIHKVCYLTSTSDAGKSDVIDFLKRVPKSVKNGFMRWIEMYIKDGRSVLTGETFHEAGEDVYRFRSGRYRLYCFFDEERMIVLSHGVMKKTQKTASKDLSKAKRLRAEYMDAKQAASLVESS